MSQVRTLTQHLQTMTQLQQTAQEIRDSNIRIEMIALELLRINPDSPTAKQALEHSQTALSRNF